MMFRQPGSHQGRLLEELQATVAAQFPATSRSEGVGTPAHNTYLGCVDKFIAAFVATGSIGLLQVLASIFCRETGHLREEAMQDGLATLAQRGTTTEVAAVAEWLFAMYLDPSYLTAQRRAAVQLLLLPLLHAVSTASLVDFFCFHIAAIIRCLANPLPKYVPAFAAWPVAVAILMERVVHPLYGCTLAADRTSWWTTSPTASAPLICCSWPTSGSPSAMVGGIALRVAAAISLRLANGWLRRKWRA